MTYKSEPVTDYQRFLDGAQLIDVREPHEFTDLPPLPEATNIVMDTIPDHLGEIDRDKPVLLVCRSGGLSGKVAEYLVAQGYTDVTNLEGGMLAWHEANG